MNFDHKLLEDVQIVSDRQAVLTEFCRGKNVLHLGCVDSGLTEEAIKIGNFLQSKIANVANSVVGIDNDLIGLEFLERNKKNNEKFLHLDIENINSSTIKEDIDIIIAGEMLEHLSCPGKFLENIQVFMSVKKAIMVLSVPNSFSLRSVFSVWDGNEYVHPDHNYYFSFATIKNFCNKYKLGIDKVFTYCGPFQPARGTSSVSLSHYVRKKMLEYFIRKSPFLAEGLIFVIKAE